MLADFLPHSANGSVLVTSRTREVAYRLTGSYANIIEFQPMDQNAGLTLLQKKFLGLNTDTDDMVKLLQTLEYMPLAITQAAAYIQQRAPRMTISHYLAEIRINNENECSLLTKTWEIIV